MKKIGVFMLKIAVVLVIILTVAAVTVGLAFSIEPGMEPFRYFLTGVYADVLRQIPAKLRQNTLAAHCAAAVEIRHLAQSMGAGVSPAAAGNFHSFPQDPGQSLLQLSLYGIILTRQTLPPLVPGTVIADLKPQIPHIPPTLPLPPAHCQRKTGNSPYDRKPGYVPAHFE